MSVNRKIFGLASSLALFAGMAYGQNALVCGGTVDGVTLGISPTNPIELRAEGATELVSDTVTPCQAATATIQGNVTAYITGSGVQGITSKSIGGGLSEATLQIIDISGGNHNTVYYSGSVSGSQVTFGTTTAPVSFPQFAFAIQISNVRVNVSGTYPNVPQPVTETVFAGAQGVAALFTVAPQTVGYIRNGLQVNGTATPVYTGAGSSTTGTAGTATSFAVCQQASTQNGGQGFTVTVTELFAGAFKTGTVTATNQGGTLLTPTSANIPGSESGSLILGSTYGVDTHAAGSLEGENFPTSTTTPVGTSTSGTRIKFVFANIPTNVTLSVPLTLTSPNGAAILTMQLDSGTETGAFSAATSGTLTASGGAATAIYEVTVANLTVIKSTQLPVTVSYAPNSVVAPAGPITVTTSFSPSPATPGAALPATIPTIPYFANTGTVLNGTTFAVCQTTLLFPFVTNQSGFETGIAIANTGLDNLNPTAKITSAATGQAGACTINFYGSIAAEGGTQPTQPTASNFPASTSKTITTIAPGQTHADTLTDVAGGPFQGYAIAVCPFLYARGFAFIEYGLATSNGVVEGYLADVINSNRSSNFAVPSTPYPVLSNAPETSGQ